MIDRLIAAAARHKKQDKGFSLIELLVVVVIIGILAAIAIPIFLNQRQGAWRSAVESDVANARIAVETAMMENNGALPTLPTGDVTGSGNTIGDVPFAVTEDVTLEFAEASEDHSYTVTGKHENLDPSESYVFNSSDGTSTWNPGTSGGEGSGGEG